MLNPKNVLRLIIITDYKLVVQHLKNKTKPIALRAAKLFKMRYSVTHARTFGPGFSVTSKLLINLLFYTEKTLTFWF